MLCGANCEYDGTSDHNSTDGAQTDRGGENKAGQCICNRVIIVINVNTKCNRIATSEGKRGGKKAKQTEIEKGSSIYQCEERETFASDNSNDFELHDERPGTEADVPADDAA